MDINNLRLGGILSLKLNVLAVVLQTCSQKEKVFGQTNYFVIEVFGMFIKTPWHLLCEPVLVDLGSCHVLAYAVVSKLKCALVPTTTNRFPCFCHGVNDNCSF